jgi:hypothetical protein
MNGRCPWQLHARHSVPLRGNLQLNRHGPVISEETDAAHPARGRVVSTNQRTAFSTWASEISLETTGRRRVEANAAFDVIAERLYPSPQPYLHHLGLMKTPSAVFSSIHVTCNCIHEADAERVLLWYCL